MTQYATAVKILFHISFRVTSLDTRPQEIVRTNLITGLTFTC